MVICCRSGARCIRLPAAAQLSAEWLTRRDFGVNSIIIIIVIIVIISIIMIMLIIIITSIITTININADHTHEALTDNTHEALTAHADDGNAGGGDDDDVFCFAHGKHAVCSFSLPRRGEGPEGHL